MAIIGTDTSGDGSFSLGGTEYLFTVLGTANNGDGVVDSVFVDLSSADGTTAVAGLYTYAGVNDAGTLLTQSDPITMSSNDRAFYEFPLNDSITVTDGTNYYVAFHADSSAAGCTIYRLNNQSGYTTFDQRNYNATLPSPCPDDSTSSHRYCIYCTYTPTKALSLMESGKLQFTGGSNQLQFMTV